MVILIVQNDDARRRLTQRFLQRAGYQVDTAATLAAGRHWLATRRYTFALVARTVADGEGLALVHEAGRRDDYSTSFILTGADDVADRLRGFAGGADDCLPGSVHLLELERRLRTITRQRFGRPRPRIRFGAGFELDLAGRRLRHGPHAVDLSRAQFDLLHHLLLHRGQPLTREQLGARVGKGTEGSNFIDVHIRNVRKALARFAPPDFLQTVRGVGYQAA